MCRIVVNVYMCLYMYYVDVTFMWLAVYTCAFAYTIMYMQLCFGSVDMYICLNVCFVHKNVDV